MTKYYRHKYRKYPDRNAVMKHLMYEDELPEDISDDMYSWWFDHSFVDGVRIGPKIINDQPGMK